MKNKIFSSIMFSAAAVALAPNAAEALTIDVNAGGAGGIVSDVQVLDWAPGNALITGGTDLNVGDVVTVYSHTRLNAFQDSTTNAITGTGLGSGYEITFVSRFDEVIYNAQTMLNPFTGKVTSFSNFTSINPDNSFFEIWFDTNPATASNMLAGTGFNDGVLIASGHIMPGGDGNMTSTYAYSGDPLNPISLNPADYPALDQFINNDYVGTRTNSGIGGALFTGLAAFDYINKDYFVDWTNSDMLIQQNSSQALPFSETDPSKLFTNVAGGVAPGQLGVATVGPINGVSTKNVVIQIDSNNSFRAVPVPIPETLSLMLIGFLAFFGAPALGKKSS